jgi:carboxyl-terminal processing protease
MINVRRIAIAVTVSLIGLQSYAFEPQMAIEQLPQLSPESQHKKASQRVTTTFTRAHYKKVELDQPLSSAIYEQYREDFQKMFSNGKLQAAYDIYNLNIKRRYQRYSYALSLLDKEFDFNKDEVYRYDREDSPWAQSESELNEIWRQKVKYDALNLKLANKEWADIKKVLSKRYNYAIKRLSQSESEDVFQVVMNAFARTVEPHTSYLSPRNAERFQMEMNLSLEGIGAVLRSEDDYTVIQSIVTGGPADKSQQLKSKDKIVGVSQDDDEFVDVIGWRLDDVVDLIKGPKGTKVRLQVLPQGSESDGAIKVVSIIRDTIKLEDRAAKSSIYFQNENDEHSKKLGVITIPSFYNKLSNDVIALINTLKEDHIDGLIIDLRGNGGGSLTEATRLSGLFIDKGPVVQVRDGANRIQVNADNDGVSYYDGPLTVIVDRYSASASEIFAAAMQDYGRAVVVGEQTFGKGTVQQHRGLGRVYDLFDEPLGSIQFTIAKFYRIDGGSTQHRGVLPDIEFPSAIDPLEWGESREDNALPWDQIRKANYRKLNDFSSDVSYLASLHQERVKLDEEFTYLQEDIAHYHQEKDKSEISLNFANRKAQREENKQKRLARANKRLALLGMEKISKIDDLPEELNELDPFMDETANITFDLISINKVAKK